jgi:putative ABC transport system ATP-binding protein
VAEGQDFRKFVIFFTTKSQRRKEDNYKISKQIDCELASSREILFLQKIPMSDNTIIAVDHLHKTYIMGDVEVHALRGVSLKIHQGEFVAIMGASGSGKSTFMNVLGCLDVPSKGEYILDGVNVGKLNKNELASIRNRKIGFVFQGFNLLSRTSALENVELPMFYNNVSNKDRREKAMEALHIVGLEDRHHHMPNQLSGGQQQRVAIARSLVNNPAIILADEPTGNLDSRTSVEVMGIFQELNNKGITIILVTHEHDIAEYAKRNVIFKDGKINKDILVAKRRFAVEEIKNIPTLTDDVEEVEI